MKPTDQLWLAEMDAYARHRDISVEQATWELHERNRAALIEMVGPEAAAAILRLG